MKPRFNPLAILALIAVAALLTAAVVPSSFVFPTRQAVQTLTGSRALVSNSSGLLTNSAVTSTELGYVSGVTSAIQTQLDAKATAANLTTVSNTVTTQGNTLSTNTALLNGTNTFTGTNNFTGAVIITNAASTISGNGAGLTNINLLNNGIGLRLLYSSPTNYTVSSSVVSATPLTNNGDYASGTPLWTATIPPLLSSNSGIMFHVILDKPNALGSSLFTGLYIGTNTNFFYYNSIGSAAGRGGFTVPSLVLENDASFTNQVNFNSTAVILATNFCNTSTSNTVYFNCWTTSASTNFTIKGYALYELVK